MSDQYEPTRPTRDPRPGAGPWSPGRWVALLVVVVLVVAAALVGVALAVGPSSPNTITVTGSGTVVGTPDTVSFQVGVATTATSAVAALELNNTRVAALQAALEAHGVTKKEMQTSGLDIYENTNSSGVVTGFTVDDDLQVTMHQLKDAGAAIDAAAHAAGNGIQLSGITFSISNQSSLLASARARAMENAKTEASQVARGAHDTVGAVLRVTDEENTGSTGVIYPVYASVPGTASPVPVQAGTQSVSVQVKVVFALNG